MDALQVLKALFMGIIEGLTEFLPISSTGHLVLFGKLIDFKSDDAHVFEIVIQLGAILAVCWLYRAKIIELIKGLLTRNPAALRFTASVLIAFFPAVIIGVIAIDFIKAVLFNPVNVAIALIMGALIIFWVESKTHTPSALNLNQITFKQAILIGLAQCVAMIPGTSRSGATIIGGMLAGLSRKTATEFSFFLAMPTMLGAASYDFYRNSDKLNQHDLLAIAIGFSAAFIAAFFVVQALVRFVEKHSLVVFAWYRIALGLLILAVYYL